MSDSMAVQFALIMVALGNFLALVLFMVNGNFAKR